jgi:cytochrome c oxidase subunit IV
MTDEIKQPTDTPPPAEGETPTSPDAPLEQVQQTPVRDLRAVPVETIPAEDVPAEVEALSAIGGDARRDVEAALNQPIEAIEKAVESIDDLPDQHEIEAHIASHEDAPVVFMGRTFNTNIYTFVFLALGALTLIEIVIAELLPRGLIRTLLLVAPSIGKALLVMAFYMHLREDNRIFAAAIALPLFFITVATLFLLAVPTTGYSY